MEKFADCPVECKTQALGYKRASGRPAKSVLALLRQPCKSIMAPIADDEPLFNDLMTDPVDLSPFIKVRSPIATRFNLVIEKLKNKIIFASNIAFFNTLFLF